MFITIFEIAYCGELIGFQSQCGRYTYTRMTATIYFQLPELSSDSPNVIFKRIYYEN